MYTAVDTWALSSLNTSQATVLAGATLEYRLTVGDAEGGAFTATLTLDPRLTLVAAPGMTSQDATLRVSGTLAPGEQRHFRITVRVGSTASGSLASSAIISNGLTSRTLEAPAIPITGVLRQVWLPLLRQ